MLLRSALFICFLITGTAGFAQISPCTSPSAPRVAILVGDINSDSPVIQRMVRAELKLRGELTKLLPTGTCLVTDLDILDDPRNFPLLKGTPVFDIHARPSFTNVETFGIAVDVRAVQGIYVEQNFHITTVAELVENDRDYARAAENIWSDFKTISEYLAGGKKESKVPEKHPER